MLEGLNGVLNPAQTYWLFCPAFNGGAFYGWIDGKIRQKGNILFLLMQPYSLGTTEDFRCLPIISLNLVFIWCFEKIVWQCVHW